MSDITNQATVNGVNALIAELQQTTRDTEVIIRDGRDGAVGDIQRLKDDTQVIIDQAREDVIAVVSAAGPVDFYDTYAQALAAAGGARRLVEVARDETRAGARTRYWAEAGALQFVMNLDQTRRDLGNPGMGPALVMAPALGPNDASASVLAEMMRKAYEVRLLSNTPTALPTPRYQVLSPVGDGNVSNAFPSVARHAGVDFVFYRAGVAHTGDDGVIKLHRVAADTGMLVDTTTVLDLSYDSRDPCVLTDDYGRAVLVGGLMKVVVFHATSNVANQVAVYDLDPANVAGGLVNRVNLPAAIVAAKSDVKPLTGGGFGFVGYSAANFCYWVTTSDWAAFTLEPIGPGNECAWGQQYDGTIAVVARQEVAPYFSLIYKKLPGGAWSLYGSLPYRLAAPSLRKTATTINSNETASTTGQHGGWLLLAKDRRESPNMSNLDAGAVKLIALLSRNNYGREINDFSIAQEVIGMAHSSVKNPAVGDSFYATAVTSEFGSEVVIYSQMQIERDAFQANGSYAAKIVKIMAKFRPGVGLVTQAPYRMPENLAQNGDFSTVRFWSVGQNSVIANNRLNIANTSLSPSTGQTLGLKAGQYRIHTRARRVSGDGDGTNQHLYVRLLGAGSALIGQVSMQGTAARLGSDFHILRSQPFNIPADGQYTLQITGAAGTATSEIDWVYLGTADDLFEFVDAWSGEKTSIATAAMGGISSGTPPVLAASYSASFWDLFSLPRDATGRPYVFQSPQEAMDSLRVLSAVDSSTQKKLTVRSLAVNANYSISVELEHATGPINSPASVRFECRVKY